MVVNRPLAERFIPTNFNPLLGSAPALGNFWRGGCFAAILNANNFIGASGQVEVRAIAIPNFAGQPRILQNSDGQDLGDKSLTLWVDTADGLTLYPIAYIQPGWMGESEVNNPDKPYADPIEGIAAAANSMGDNTQGGWTAALRNADYDLVRGMNVFNALKRWGVIRADLAHGATKAGVRLVDSTGAGLNIGLLRLKDLTVRRRQTSGGGSPAIWFDSIHAESTESQLGDDFRDGLVASGEFAGGQLVTDCTATVIDRFVKDATLVDRCTVSRTAADALKNVRAAYDSDFTELGFFVTIEHVDGVQWFDQDGIDFDNVIYDSLRFYQDDFNPGRLQPFFFRTGNSAAPGRIRNMAIANCVAVPADDAFPTRSQSRLTLEHFLLLQTSQAHSAWTLRDDEQGGNPPGPPIVRTLKNILVLGGAFHELEITNTGTRTNIVVDQNRFEVGLDWQQYGSNLVLAPQAFDWSLPVLIPTTGGNLANIVPIWTAPADVVGADRPFSAVSLFRAYVGAYEP